MKKLIFTILFCMTMSVSFASEQYVCGETYIYYYEEIVYLLKFESSNPSLPCTSGTAKLFWLNQTLSKPFTVNSKYLITVTDFGKFYEESGKLYFLDTASIVFAEY